MKGFLLLEYHISKETFTLSLMVCAPYGAYLTEICVPMELKELPLLNVDT